MTGSRQTRRPDAFCPGHLDQHLYSFYERGLAEGTLTRERAEELGGTFEFIPMNEGSTIRARFPLPEEGE